MANSLNRWTAIGRLCADVDVHTFSNGGSVATIRLAVNNSKKDQSGEWVDDPVFVTCKGFDREHGQKLATLLNQYTRKGDQIYVEGRLKLETWESNGQQQSRLVCYLDTIQLLIPKPKGEGQQSQNRPASNNQPANNNRPANNSRPANNRPAGNQYSEPNDNTYNDDDIPF